MIGSICFYCGEIIDGRYKLVPLDGKYHTNLFFHNEDSIGSCYAKASEDMEKYIQDNLDRITLYNFGIPTKEQKKIYKNQLKENEDDVQEKRFGWSSNASNESNASTDDGDATSE